MLTSTQEKSNYLIYNYLRLWPCRLSIRGTKRASFRQAQFERILWIIPAFRDALRPLWVLFASSLGPRAPRRQRGGFEEAKRRQRGPKEEAKRRIWRFFRFLRFLRFLRFEKGHLKDHDIPILTGLV